MVALDHGFEAGCSRAYLTGVHRFRQAAIGLPFARRRARLAGSVALLALAASCGGELEAPPVTPSRDSAVQHLAPAAPPPSPQGVSAIASGGGSSFATFSHTCAVVGGGVQCWGANTSGQAGAGLLARRSPVPVWLRALGREVTAVAAGGSHACALAGGVAMCWGENARRQLATRKPQRAPLPIPVDGLPEPVTGIGAGAEHSCAVAGGELWCWGRNQAGALGSAEAEVCKGAYAAVSCRSTPRRVEGLAPGVSAFALGGAHTCAVANGEVSCWGQNDRGQLGGGSADGGAAPVPVRGLGGPATALAAGFHHTCALVGGAVKCWGANDRGQLGDGSNLDRSRPVNAQGLDSGVTAIAAGSFHTCAIAGGSAHCWGRGDEGQLGPPVAARRPVPVAVRGLDGVVTALSAGADQTCAVLDGSRVLCWGDNDFGQLGSGDAPRDHHSPVAVAAWDDGRIRDRNRDGVVKVVCLGDSNTRRAPDGPEGWCELLGEHFPDSSWVAVNRGQGGATAVSRGSFFHAEGQLAYALENDAADVLILAFGTNDLLRGIPANEVAMAYLNLRLRAREAGAAVFVALTPPVQPDTREVNQRITELNDLLRENWPPARVVDFWSDMTTEDFADRLHLNAAGQGKRASAAWAALRAASPAAEAR